MVDIPSYQRWRDKELLTRRQHVHQQRWECNPLSQSLPPICGMQITSHNACRNWSLAGIDSIFIPLFEMSLQHLDMCMYIPMYIYALLGNKMHMWIYSANILFVNTSDVHPKRCISCTRVHHIAVGWGRLYCRSNSSIRKIDEHPLCKRLMHQKNKHANSALMYTEKSVWWATIKWSADNVWCAHTWLRCPTSAVRRV